MTSDIVQEALVNIVDILKANDIEYCIFGGLALQAYGRIRATKDVDVLASIHTMGVDKLIKILHSHGFVFDLRRGVIKIRDFEFFRCLYKEKDYGIELFVDLVMAGAPFQEEILKRKKQVMFFDKKINIASCEDLILLKLLADRPIDIVDAEELIEQNKDKLEKGYLKLWAARLGIKRRLQGLLRFRK